MVSQLDVRIDEGIERIQHISARASPFIMDDFLRQSTVMFFSSLLAASFSYLYQIYVGRTLGPVEYGIFGSLFSIFYFISVFSLTVQTSSARFISQFKTTGNDDCISIFLHGLIKKSIMLGIFGFVIFILISPLIADFLNIDSEAELVMLGTIILLAFLQPATFGAVQGLQKFYWFGLINILNLGLKFALGVILVTLGYGVSGALGAVTLGMAGAFLISIYPLKPFLGRRSKEKNYNFKKLYLYSAPTLLVMVCLAVPSNADVIVAKHFLAAYDAGLYTSVSVLGKIILFLPVAIANVMFPKASRMEVLGAQSRIPVMK